MLEDIVNAASKIERTFRSTANIMKNDIQKYGPVAKPIAGSAAIASGLYSLFYGVSFLPAFLALGVAGGLLALTFYAVNKGVKYYYNKFNKLRHAYA